MLRKTVGPLVSLLSLLILGVASAQGPGDDGIGDPDFPLLGNAGYDVKHYTLDLTVNVEANTIAGTATIAAVITEDVRTFNLDFASNFDITGVTLDGAPVDWDRSEHELTLMPPDALRAGDEIEISVVYSGEPQPVRSKAIPVKLGWSNYETGVYVASEPDGSAGWFPVNDHPLDKATYTLRFTVPEPYLVAANGVLTETIDNGGTATYVWEMRDPMASYLVTVGIDDFVVQTSEGPLGLPIRNYFPPDVAEEAAELFAPTADMIAFFSEIFGPYPFEAYGVYVTDVDLPIALETQTMTMFSRSWLKFGDRLEEAIAHELSHQWFGNSVSLSAWGDIWLNEGFATYASWLWYEHSKNPTYLEGIVTVAYESFAERLRLPPPPGAPPADDLFNISVYYWGALTLHALRLEVGDEVFFQILRTYYDRYKYSNATTADFIAVAEEISGRELDEFFDAWLYGETLPDIPAMGLSMAAE